MQLHTINTQLFKLDGGAMFGVVPKTIWNKLNAADDSNMCTWAMRLLLIESGNKLVLIDTGIGNKQSDKFFGHYYLHGNYTLEKSLNEIGFTKNDITDVILTHLHFDHCGGCVERDENGNYFTAFKNATYWSNEAHWQWAINPNEREKASFLKENILPIKESGQLKFVDNFFAETDTNLAKATSTIIPELSFILTNGHTKAMMLPCIKYKERNIVFMADLLPSVAHIPMPYIMAYDMFPMISLKEKKIFLNEAINNNYTLFFEHDKSIECCTLQQTEKGIKPKDCFNLKDI